MKRSSILILFLWISLANVALAQAQDAPRWIRVCLLEAVKAETFTVDKKINTLEKFLKEICTSPKTPDIVKAFRQFSPITITKPQKIEFGAKHLIPLDREKTMFLDITLQPLQDNYFPTSARWFSRDGEKEKVIIEIPKHKFYNNRCLLLFDGKGINKDTKTFHILAVEFVDPKSKNQTKQ